MHGFNCFDFLDTRFTSYAFQYGMINSNSYCSGFLLLNRDGYGTCIARHNGKLLDQVHIHMYTGTCGFNVHDHGNHFFHAYSTQRS